MEMRPTNLSLQQSSDENSVEQQSPREGGYGWVVVLCTFLINAHTWGINSVSLFVSFESI